MRLQQRREEKIAKEEKREKAEKKPADLTIRGIATTAPTKL
jgi:hypothetical protein